MLKKPKFERKSVTADLDALRGGGGKLLVKNAFALGEYVKAAS